MRRLARFARDIPYTTRERLHLRRLARFFAYNMYCTQHASFYASAFFASRAARHAASCSGQCATWLVFPQ